MFRVPKSAEEPTYDDTFDVSFWQWLRSSKADRVEWARRRNAATHTMSSMRKMQAKLDQAQARKDAKRRR